MGKIMYKYTEKDFLNLLLNHQVHIYNNSLIDTKILPFIMGVRKGFTILDLSKTLSLLKKILFMVEEHVSNKGKIILICDMKLNRNELRELKENFIVLENKWPEGALTNFSNTRYKSSLNKEQHLVSNNNFSSTSLSSKLNKKRKSQIRRFFNKFQSLGFLKEYPRLVIYITSTPNISVFNEFKSLNIPVAVLSDNLTLSEIADYPVLCNVKDSLFIKLFVSLLINFSHKGFGRLRSKLRYNTVSTINKKKIIKLLNIKNDK